MHSFNKLPVAGVQQDSYWQTKLKPFEKYYFVPISSIPPEVSGKLAHILDEIPFAECLQNYRSRVYSEAFHATMTHHLETDNSNGSSYMKSVASFMFFTAEIANPLTASHEMLFISSQRESHIDLLKLVDHLIPVQMQRPSHVSPAGCTPKESYNVRRRTFGRSGAPTTFGHAGVIVQQPPPPVDGRRVMFKGRGVDSVEEFNTLVSENLLVNKSTPPINRNPASYSASSSSSSAAQQTSVVEAANNITPHDHKLSCCPCGSVRLGDSEKSAPATSSTSAEQDAIELIPDSEFLMDLMRDCALSASSDAWHRIGDIENQFVAPAFQRRVKALISKLSSHDGLFQVLSALLSDPVFMITKIRQSIINPPMDPEQFVKSVLSEALAASFDLYFNTKFKSQAVRHRIYQCIQIGAIALVGLFDMAEKSRFKNGVGGVQQNDIVQPVLVNDTTVVTPTAAAVASSSNSSV